jgi:hypothetical protein
MTALRYALAATCRYGVRAAAGWLWSYAVQRWPD